MNFYMTDLFKNKMAMLIFVVMLFFVVAPFLLPQVGLARLEIALQPPSVNYWLGTDNTGRSMLLQILYGARAAFCALRSSVV